MWKPWLPLHPADAWELGFALDEDVQVASIEARGGMVVAGGVEIYTLRPGAALWTGHAPPPYDVGPVRLVAVEPRGARRHAIASAETVTMFVKAERDGDIEGISASVPGSKVTHIAWGGMDGPSTLFFLRDDHVLYEMEADRSGGQALAIEPLHAIASDDRGVVAMVSLSARRPRVLVMSNGRRWEARVVDAEVRPGASVQVAVADTAVALVVDEEYVLLSRARGEPFARVPALDLGENEHGWRVGPVSFQGSSRDAALLCARSEDDLERIIRVDQAGAAVSILEVAGTEIRDAPDIVSLSWDASRQTLWGATSDAGIFKVTPPEARGKKKVVLS
jgi:hypothetical protein